MYVEISCKQAIHPINNPSGSKLGILGFNLQFSKRKYLYYSNLLSYTLLTYLERIFFRLFYKGSLVSNNETH